ncbi:MAG: hypothetical protein WD942_04180 [Dehalococcoidia bacterium]
MTHDIALKVLGQIMGWDDERAGREFTWLTLMSRLKFDGYQDFEAGVRMIESLAVWLQQFDPADREAAYRFLRNVVLYLGPAEMLRLVELFFPVTVQRRLMHAAAQQTGVPAYQVWSNPASASAYDRLLRCTLFVGMSEGARLDLFRRANAGLVSNEQVLLATYADKEKWDDLLDNLREDLKDPQARFGAVYLIDDFAGSGLTFIRKDKGKWKGKLKKFRQSVVDGFDTYFDPGVQFFVHHYIATHDAAENLRRRQGEALTELGAEGWITPVRFTFGMILREDFPVDRSPLEDAQTFLALAERYYDPKIKTKHFDVGGDDEIQLGFAGCALPLVLEHNTPNNSVALLWAESELPADWSPEDAHVMRPLFRRRQRHT